MTRCRRHRHRHRPQQQQQQQQEAEQQPTATQQLFRFAKSNQVTQLKELLDLNFPLDEASSRSSAASRDRTASSVALEERRRQQRQRQRQRLQLLFFSQDAKGTTALHCAASAGHVDMVHFLLQEATQSIRLETNQDAAEADHQETRDFRQAIRHFNGGRKAYSHTPLHEAAIGGHLQICRLLIRDFGFLVDCHSTRGRTPLMYAAKNNHLELVRFLVTECGAHVNERDEIGVTCVYMAAEHGHTEMVRALFLLGADVNICNRVRHSPLHEAIAHGFVETAACLIDCGADKRAVDAMGVTLWHEAAGHGDVRLLELLLAERVPLLGVQDDQQEGRDRILGRHAFHYAAVEGHAEFVEEMLHHQLVEVNLHDVDGCTALYYAAANGHAQVVKVLLQHGADPNLCSKRRSPLHCAVEWNRLECVHLLLQHGASLDARDQHGDTPSEVASNKNLADMVACFEKLNDIPP